jgi:transposase
VFVFRNRRATAIKVLVYDGQGYWLCQKRLEAGTFQTPEAEGDSVTLSSTQLAMLLGGFDLRGTRQRKRYRRAG